MFRRDKSPKCSGWKIVCLQAPASWLSLPYWTSRRHSSQTWRSRCYEGIQETLRVTVSKFWYQHLHVSFKRLSQRVRLNMSNYRYVLTETDFYNIPARLFGRTGLLQIQSLEYPVKLRLCEATYATASQASEHANQWCQRGKEFWDAPVCIARLCLLASTISFSPNSKLLNTGCI
jgi:hypothetical protein